MGTLPGCGDHHDDQDEDVLVGQGHDRHDSDDGHGHEDDLGGHE